jgi:uncharacterized protein
VKASATVSASALIASALTLPAFAQGFDIPAAPDHYVTDNAGVLSNDTRTSLERELQAYESATGHQIIVWIGQSTGAIPLESWTLQAANHWKVGRQKYDDGAVLFIFMQDRKVRIEVGYGLESVLTDADAYRIIESVIRPRMRAGEVDGAVSNGVAAMLTTITPAYKGVASPEPQSARYGLVRRPFYFYFGLAWILLRLGLYVWGMLRSTAGGKPIVKTLDAPTLFLLGALAALVVIGLSGPTTPLIAAFGLAGIVGIIVFILVMDVVGTLRYGYLVTREGAPAARRDMAGWLFWGGGMGASGFGGSGGGGFSGGGGGFGGGGASGGW